MRKRRAPMPVGASRADQLVRILAQECATCNPIIVCGGHPDFPGQNCAESAASGRHCHNSLVTAADPMVTGTVARNLTGNVCGFCDWQPVGRKKWELMVLPPPPPNPR